MLNFDIPKKWTPIVVTWIDIHVVSDAHDPKDYVSNYEPCIRKTAGFFLAVSKGHLFIAETDDRLANTEHDAERINSFPLEVLRSIHTITP